jgi:hypothetical protein
MVDELTPFTQVTASIIQNFIEFATGSPIISCFRTLIIDKSQNTE